MHPSAIQDLETAAKIAYESRGWPAHARVNAARISVFDDEVAFTVTFPPGWTVPTQLGDVLSSANALVDIAHIDPRIPAVIDAVRNLWRTSASSTGPISVGGMVTGQVMREAFGDLTRRRQQQADQRADAASADAARCRRREDALRRRIKAITRERTIKTGYPG